MANKVDQWLTTLLHSLNWGAFDHTYPPAYIIVHPRGHSRSEAEVQTEPVTPLLRRVTYIISSMPVLEEWQEGGGVFVYSKC